MSSCPVWMSNRAKNSRRSSPLMVRILVYMEGLQQWFCNGGGGRGGGVCARERESVCNCVHVCGCERVGVSLRDTRPAKSLALAGSKKERDF